MGTDAAARLGILRRSLRSPKAMTALLLLAGFALMATAGPWLVQDPTAYVGVPFSPPCSASWLGTTGQGQDVLAQLVVGTRGTLVLGFAVGGVTVAIGALLGVAAAYLGGWVDWLISVTINVFLVIPSLPLAILLAAYLPTGPVSVAVVLVVTGWAWHARILRAQALALRSRDFVHAAKVLGESTPRILIVEMLPNMLALLGSSLLGATIYAIGAEVGLEFLGIGDVSRVTWGTNLYWASNDSALLLGAWWAFVPTGLCLALVGFSLTLLNHVVDEMGNPALRSERSWQRVLQQFGVIPGHATPVVTHG
jgi:peptide/nickel transport system permease protein